jgi:hypothetical protein
MVYEVRSALGGLLIPSRLHPHFRLHQHQKSVVAKRNEDFIAKNFRHRDLLMREETEIEIRSENMTQRDRDLCDQTAQSSNKSLMEKT